MWRLLACTPQPALDAPPLPSTAVEFELGRARIVATGDVMMHGAVKASARTVDHRLGGHSINHGGYRELFEDVAPILAQADLAFANLESPIAPGSGKRARSMVFNAHPVVLDALAETGFDIVSFANNHVYDQGRHGFTETLDHLDASDLQAIGAGWSCEEAYAPVLVVSGGVWIAWLAVTQLQNDALNTSEDAPCVAEFDIDKITASIARARQDGADVVVLSVHWGVEYETIPRRFQHRLAHDLVERGVDVLLGHHPHVLQPVERVQASDGRVGLVAYSLGNFISNQASRYDPARDPIASGNERDGVLLAFDVVTQRRSSDESAIIETRIDDVELIPLWTRNDRRQEPPISVSLSTDRREHTLSVLSAALPPPEPRGELHVTER